MTRSLPRSTFIDVDGLRLHCLEWGERGDAPPLVLLHGGSANAHWWDFVAPALAARHHVVALDLRGHGESGASPQRNYAIDTHARDVHALVGTLGAEHIVLVGHSFGGFVALACAPGLEAQLAGLVLVDSRGRIGKRSARYINALGKFPHPVYTSPDDAIRRFRLLPTGTTASPEVLAHMARHSIVEKADGTWSLRFDRKALSGLVERDLGEEKRQVRCPVLLVRGALSKTLSPSGLQALATELPTARSVDVEEIENAYHHVMLDQPEALATALGRFLDSAEVSHPADSTR
jgi:pimeloyl-ACP methyl ester carboxylesterase